MELKERIALLRKTLDEYSERSLEFHCQKDLDKEEECNILCTIINGYLEKMEGKESLNREIQELEHWKIGVSEFENWEIGICI